MDGYKILIKPSAVKELEGFPKQDRERIIRRIRGLSDNPRSSGCEKLSHENGYRVRQGKHRIVFAVDDSARTALIVKIGHRREVYR